ncbi:pulmonary surfactant-associated protein D-like [Penaeus japonicus]|uniref:pulmonary surfactant-associated protein D-like n=1 Tax=Penaeus japonicus TaxID=27405 RepID=UPI001C71756A|nr:pulmonary surfactant-associated protein D-like [Penaeus japonicus]
MMKFLLMLALAAAAAGDLFRGGHFSHGGHFPHGGQGFRPPTFRIPHGGHGFRPPTFRIPHGGHGFRPPTVHRPVQPVRPVVHRPAPATPVRPSPSRPVVHQPSATDPLVDRSLGESDYHFSWLHDGGKTYDWEGANRYCSRLGRGWAGISIETREEDNFVNEVVEASGLPWIWTSGHLKGHGFAWESGKPFVGLNWSPTGGNGRPQPDNRERGGERCLGVLNNFYDDGIKWHDIACHHDKAIICERPRGFH